MSIADNIAKVEAQIAETIKQCGREKSDVHLLAVSKKQSVQAIEEAYECGLRDFGENYVQELLEKKKVLEHLKDIRWHLIGPLQRNKVKQALGAANFFHALDSEKLLLEIVQKIKNEKQGPWHVFIQVNIDDEPSKSGINPSELSHFIDVVESFSEVKLMGLMCIPKAGNSSQAFSRMRELNSKRLLQLSMGMSEDFKEAIQFGSNWIRVGTAIFGKRFEG